MLVVTFCIWFFYDIQILAPDAFAGVIIQVLNCELRLLWLLVENQSSYALLLTELIPTFKLAASYPASVN